ncbi:MAG: hypothetical protein ACP5H2_12540, partial [Solirubrobacteraceae bacterium]
MTGEATSTDSLRKNIAVKLTNNGPGVAMHVRCRLDDGPWSDAITAMQPAQQIPKGLPKPDGFGVGVHGVSALEIQGVAMSRLKIEVVFSG